MSTAQLGNPAGVNGLTANNAVVFDNYVSAETTTTIAYGEAVSINTSGLILKATTSVEPRLVIGLAMEAISPGEAGPVAHLGVLRNVPTQGTVNAGDLVQRSGTTAGASAAVTSAAGTQGQAHGTAIKNAASNLTDVFVSRT